MDKKELRKKVLLIRQNIHIDQRNRQSKQIMDALIKHPLFINAKTIGIYLSFRDEVNTINYIDLLMQNKKVCVPKVKGKMMDFILLNQSSTLVSNDYGILEPTSHQIVQPQEIDLLIIPIVAYDLNGQRIGYGGGYYDRYLKKYDGKTIGLAFKQQRVDNIVSEEHDIQINEVISY